jgi:hypothetical protein
MLPFSSRSRLRGGPAGDRFVVALAQTLPMMAARRMIYVRDLSTMAAEEPAESGNRAPEQEPHACVY